jgi:hypothetical protein
VTGTSVIWQPRAFICQHFGVNHRAIDSIEYDSAPRGENRNTINVVVYGQTTALPPYSSPAVKAPNKAILPMHRQPLTSAMSCSFSLTTIQLR